MLSRPNATLWRVLAATGTLLALALYVPLVQRLFGFGTLSIGALALVLGASVAAFLALAAIKAVGWHAAVRSGT
jgi:hypothetical protein